MADKRLYKIIFLNQGKVYELFSESVSSSGLWGFIEVSGLVFESGEGLVVDPTEERMRQEFISAAEFPKFVQVVKEMVEQVKKLGPTPLKPVKPEKMDAKLEAAVEAV